MTLTLGIIASKKNNNRNALSYIIAEKTHPKFTSHQHLFFPFSTIQKRKKEQTLTSYQFTQSKVKQKKKNKQTLPSYQFILSKVKHKKNKHFLHTNSWGKVKHKRNKHFLHTNSHEVKKKKKNTVNQIKVKQKRIVHQNKTNSRMKGGDPLAIHYETKFQNHFLFRETTQTKTKSRFTLLSSFIQHCLIPTNPKSISTK